MNIKSSITMNTGSIERPIPGQTIQKNTRHRFQHLNTGVENGLNTVKFDSSETEDQKIVLYPFKNLAHNKINQKAVEVHIRCIFLRIGEIDTLNERYYADILLEASWETSSFQGLQKHSFDPTIHWTPQLELMNTIGQLQDEISYSIHYDKKGMATITEHHKLIGTLWKHMELQDFPIDIQDLSILITTAHRKTEMIFVKNTRKPSGVDRRVFTDEQEWYLFEHVDIEVTEQVDAYLDNDQNHSVVMCSCHVARNYGYFMWNEYFLIFLITSASFTTFPIPLANIQGRIKIACTLLLTSILFRSACNKMLPILSYLTAVDVYAIGSIFSLCLLNIFHGVIGYVNFYISATVITSVPSLIVIDRWALVVFVLLFFAYQIATMIWIYLVPWQKRRMMFQKENENRLRFASTSNNSNATFTDVVLKAKQKFNIQNNSSIESNKDL